MTDTERRETAIKVIECALMSGIFADRREFKPPGAMLARYMKNDPSFAENVKKLKAEDLDGRHYRVEEWMRVTNERRHF